MTGRRYEVAARVRCAVPPADLWPLLRDLDRWVAVPEAELRVEVLAAEAPTTLSYRLVSGLPLRQHEATVTLLAVDGGTDICWQQSFRPRIPFTGGFLRTRLETLSAAAAMRLAEAGGSVA
ncbi:MAG: SRPBCC family protein [Actinomycetota bacterium]|nr:SRPBCC family protein [Actinomycetota bacterium]